jgi:hypothetical protein
MNNKLSRQFQEDTPIVPTYEKLAGCKPLLGSQNQPKQALPELFGINFSLHKFMLMMRCGCLTTKFFKAIPNRITFATVQVIHKY